MQNKGIVKVTQLALKQILEPYLKQLPKGADLYRIHHDPSTESLSLFFKHPLLPVVAEGQEIPVINDGYIYEQTVLDHKPSAKTCNRLKQAVTGRGD